MGMNGMENEDLAVIISRVRAHDNVAFAQLVELYQPLLKKHAKLFMRDGFDFDDAYSEAQCALYRAALHYKTEQTEVSFGLYATRCIVNALITQYKRDSKAPVTVPLEEDLVLTVTSDRMEEEEKYEALLSNIRSVLTEIEYSAFFAVYAENMPYAEAAKSLGWDEKKVRNAVARALDKVRNSKLGSK